MNIDLAKQVLIVDEGHKNRPYKDILGNWTIGVGYLIGPSLDDLWLSNDVIEAMLIESIGNAIKDLKVLFPSFDSYEEARQLALLSMVYNLGKPKLSLFSNMLEAIKANDWERAAREALDSLWAKQVGLRATRLASMLASGTIHPSYE